MIINVRGANGSGKSTLARRVKELYVSSKSFTLDGRKRPLYYELSGSGYHPIIMLGAYETPTGGCDTIPEVETVFTLARMHADAGRHVFFEGILAQHSSTRLLELHETHRVTVICLSTSLEECVESVVARRHARGQIGEFDPKNVAKEWRSVRSSAKTLGNSGLAVTWASREEAFQIVRAQLDLANTQATVITG